VPNFSFEQYDTCPNLENQVHYATGWSNYRNSGTPDYYNVCSPTSFGIPYSTFTHQDEHRNCNAYAALVTYARTIINYKEHIGIQLSLPLVIGQKYFISFYTVMSEFFLGGTQYGMPSNNIGIRLSTVNYTSSNGSPIDNFAHLRSFTIINDSVNWNRISGSIIADSAYEFLIIGNFFDDANTDTMHYACGSCLNYGSYYLVDDICVSTDSSLCNGGLDELPCLTSVNEIHSSNEISIFPNPTTSTLTLNSPTSYINTPFTIYNSLGEKVYQSIITSTHQQINLAAAAGVYFLRVEGEDAFVKKVIVY
jgi:hypothetical protein